MLHETTLWKPKAAFLIVCVCVFVFEGTNLGLMHSRQVFYHCTIPQSSMFFTCKCMIE